MSDTFTITMIGKGEYIEVDINDELDFTKKKYEVCIQDILYQPVSWSNIRVNANFMLVIHNAQTTVLYIPPENYYTLSALLYRINEQLIKTFGATADLFCYNDPVTVSDRKTVFPQPYSVTDDTLFNTQKDYKRRFLKKDDYDKAILKEAMGMEMKPSIVRFGGGTVHLSITFCKQIAVILGILPLASIGGIPLIVPGWRSDISKIGMTRNTIPSLWVYGDFVVTSMIGDRRDNILKVLPITANDASVAISHVMSYGNDYVLVQRRKIKIFKLWFKEEPHHDYNLNINEDVVIVLLFRLKQ